jgi:Xaa-Pro aminopeptidase
MSIYKTRLQALRQEMNAHGIDAYIIPQTDAWQSESLNPCDERLHYICGLSASAGYVVITHDKAAVLIDGRYTVQAGEQVDTSLFDIEYYTDIPPIDWATKHISDDDTIGFDPWLHTNAEAEKMRKKHQHIKALATNLADVIWQDRPTPRQQTAIIHDIEFSGIGIDEKLDLIAKDCKENTLITAPDSLAWLLNLRVLDNTQAPGLRGYGLFAPSSKTITVYTDVDCTVLNHPSVTFKPLADIDTMDGDMAIPKSAPSWFMGKSDNIIDHDPCVMPKACKNDVEQRGIRASHKRDAVAVKNTIDWIKSFSDITENDVAKKLIEMRAKANNFRGVSFDSIVGFNANGAKIHGSPTNTKIEGNGLLLIDSGGQYDDGTTDITRTIAIGTPSADMVEKYTLVLKAHIAIATAVFPKGTDGKQLDAMCRAPLWASGLNFAHGTGHGVGHFLNVHEGPANISPKSTEPLQVGMLLSNEPGYYLEGAFGIRLENLMLVQNHPEHDGYLHFETVTFVPFDTDCIDTRLLTEAEQIWTDNYHAQCN